MSIENEMKEDLLYALVANCQIQEAPTNMSLNGFVSVLIGVGNDDTAEILIPADSLAKLYERVQRRALAKEQACPKVRKSLSGKAKLEWPQMHALEINYHD